MNCLKSYDRMNFAYDLNFVCYAQLIMYAFALQYISNSNVCKL